MKLNNGEYRRPINAVGEQITMARIIKLIDVHYRRNMGFIRFAYFAVRHAIVVMRNKGTRVGAIP